MRLHHQCSGRYVSSFTTSVVHLVRDSASSTAPLKKVNDLHYTVPVIEEPLIVPWLLAGRDDVGEQERETDPQSLRDSILNRPRERREEVVSNIIIAAPIRKKKL